MAVAQCGGVALCHCGTGRTFQAAVASGSCGPATPQEARGVGRPPPEASDHPLALAPPAQSPARLARRGLRKRQKRHLCARHSARARRPRRHLRRRSTQAYCPPSSGAPARAGAAVGEQQLPRPRPAVQRPRMSLPGRFWASVRVRSEHRRLSPASIRYCSREEGGGSLSPP